MQIEELSLAKGCDFIELYKILKVQGLVDGGGAAKQVIDLGLVTVNGAVETRKRNKIIPGDTVSYNGTSIKIIFNNNQ